MVPSLPLRAPSIVDAHASCVSLAYFRASQTEIGRRNKTFMVARLQAVVVPVPLTPDQRHTAPPTQFSDCVLHVSFFFLGCLGAGSCGTGHTLTHTRRRGSNIIAFFIIRRGTCTGRAGNKVRHSPAVFNIYPRYCYTLHTPTWSLFFSDHIFPTRHPTFYYFSHPPLGLYRQCATFRWELLFPASASKSPNPRRRKQPEQCRPPYTAS